MGKTLPVPPAHVEAGFPLGAWVGNRRVDYRNGRLPPRRIKRLESVPEWIWDSRRDTFEEGFDHLLRFVKRATRRFRWNASSGAFRWEPGFTSAASSETG